MNAILAKSVHITNFYHKDSGGISTSYNSLLAAAERHQRFIRLIVPAAEESIEDVNAFARIYYVPARRSPIFDKRYRLIMPWQYMVTDSIVRRILLAEMPDMIEVTDKYTLSMLSVMIRTGNFRRIKRPMLVHFSCERMDDSISSFLKGGSVGRAFARTLIRNYHLPIFDFHIANSVYTAGEFFDAASRRDGTSHNGRVNKMLGKLLNAPAIPLDERVFVCPRGVDNSFFSPANRSERVRSELIELAGGGPDTIILLYAGRLSPEKNTDLLLDMMVKLSADRSRDYQMLIAGDGPSAKRLNARSKELSAGNITILGHLAKERLADLYANADVFVHPNPREPFGIGPLEAMASGVPVLAPNSGGLLTYANDENAWLVEPTADDFAAAVKQVVANDELRRRKTENAVRTAAENTRESSTDNLLATYDRMFEEFRRRYGHFTGGGSVDDIESV